MISLDFTEKPRCPRPALLLHPPIPLTLSGVNPRTIRGAEWWDAIRKEAYAKYDYHCWACDVHRLDTKSQRLDAHECYTYNYKRKRAYLVEVVALCRDCHYFIHWLRVRYRYELFRILPRGLKILHEAGIGLPYNQVKVVKTFDWLEGLEFLDTAEIGSELPIGILWHSDWKLVYEGKLYPKGGKR